MARIKSTLAALTLAVTSLVAPIGAEAALFCEYASNGYVCVENISYTPGWDYTDVVSIKEGGLYFYGKILCRDNGDTYSYRYSNTDGYSNMTSEYRLYLADLYCQGRLGI